MPAKDRNALAVFDGLCMYAFIVLGLPDGMIGTAWPAMRHSFGAPLEDIGVILLATSFGGVATSTVSGLVVGWTGTRRTIMMAATVGACGGLAALASPDLALLVVAGAFIGLAAGFMDGSVNIAAGTTGRTRLLNLLHGCYGIGTTLGPLVVTAALLATSSWRPAYGALVVLEAVLLGGWWWAGRHLAATGGTTAGLSAGTVSGTDPPAPARFAAGTPAAEPSLPAGPSVPTRPSLPTELSVPPGPSLPTGRGRTSPPHHGRPHAGRRGRLIAVVALGLFVFLVYTGMEVGAGQWEPSYDRGPLHLSTAATGVAVFGYGAALPLVRLARAVPRRPPAPGTVVRWGCLVACGGAAVVWWGPSVVVSLLGFVVIGASLAGVFPALVVLTPSRVGESTAHHVIGWQIGAAGAGGSLMSAAFGVIFQHLGFSWFGPCLVIVAVVLFASSELLARAGPYHPQVLE